jgi:hypothetical protein
MMWSLPPAFAARRGMAALILAGALHTFCKAVETANEIAMNDARNHRTNVRYPRPVKAFLLAAVVLPTALFTGTLAGMPAARAQGVHQYSFPGSSAPSSYSTSTGARVYRGTAVPTGRGPLDQPIPPAASSYYSRHLGRATTPTNPSPYPFGTQ